jgi:hypothetical protein
MTSHIDIPLEVIEDLMKKVTAGETNAATSVLLAIRGLMVDPNVRSIFEINAASLIHFQTERIKELEKAADLFERDMMSGKLRFEFCKAFREWMTNSKSEYHELVKDLTK